jgi:hypothetical protein
VSKQRLPGLSFAKSWRPTVLEFDVFVTIGFAGLVTLPTKERDWPTALEISSSRDCLAPRAHRRCAENAMRWSGSEVALDVEGVEDGSVSRENWTRTSRTSPSASTARHRYAMRPEILR